MITSEITSEAQIKQYIERFNLDEEALRMIIEGDPLGIITRPLFVVTDSGSSYEIELLGPTVEALHDRGIAKVRAADYVRTQENDVVGKSTTFIGLTKGKVPKLQFYPSRDVRSENSTEYTTIAQPTSGEILPGNAKLVVTESNE